MIENKSRYSLLLINPKIKLRHYNVQSELAHLMRKKTSIVPLSLPLIAGMTPDNYDIQIIDEEIKQISKINKFDLVGITTLTASLNRAFELGDKYRAAGATVVMGGPSATFMEEEVLKHADAIVIGEAEGVWEKFLKDFEEGKLEKVYKAKIPVEFKRSKLPRWDLVDTKKVLSYPIEISRGCPYDCEFCVVTKIYGHRPRYRDMDDVINEILALPVKRFLIVDDNLTMNKKYCKELMNRLKPLNVSWMCQASLDIAKHDDLLKGMADAGCMSIVMGFESLNPSSLQETKKYHNRKEHYANVIKKIHSYGINIISSFIIGFDSDTDEDLENISDFIIENNIPYSMISILCAPYGTDLYKRLEQEGRIMPVRHELKCGLFPTIRFKNFSTLELFDKYFEASKKIKSFANINKMADNLFNEGKFNRNLTGDVTVKMKFLTTITILKIFVFTRDKDKRILFLKLFKLKKEDKIGTNEMVGFLLSIAGFNKFFKDSKTIIEEVRNEMIPLNEEALTK